MKEIFGISTIALAFIGYIPYLRDTFQGRTRPHLVSWFLWTMVSFIAFGLQWSEGAGAGSYANFAMGLICSVLFFASLKNGNKQVRSIDLAFFVMAILSIILWLIVKKPVISIILVVLIDVFSFIPTFIKSWYHPWEETLSTWLLNTLRQGIIILSISDLNLVTLLFPLYAFIANSLFCTLLLLRRRALKFNQSS